MKHFCVVLAKYYRLMFMQPTPICSRTFVGTTDRGNAGVSCGQFGTFRLKFHCKFPGNRWIHRFLRVKTG